MEKIVVVGANHAGTAAVNTILSQDANKKVVVFDRNSNISFLGCGMALWIGGQISSGDGLFYSSKEKLEAKGAEVHMETEVYDVDYDKKIVFARDINTGKEYQESYDKLVLSTGSLPIQIPVPGTELENVQFVKLYQNAKEVIEKLEHKKDIDHVTVVGAGYIGVELVEAFARWGKKVTLVDFADDCLSTYYDEIFRKMMRKNLEEHGIEMKFHQKLVKIQGDGKVESILTDKEEIKTDMVVLCVGFKPNAAIGKGELETFRNGAFLVNKKQETSKKDVYAIGDCATVWDNTIGAANYIALASNALRSGIIAGNNICGNDMESPGVQGSNGISIYGLHMVSTGLTFEKAERMGLTVGETTLTDLQRPEFIETQNLAVTIRIVYDLETRVILGAQMASREDISMGMHMFSLAIQEKVTIDKLKLLDILFLPHYNKPYNYITMAAMQAK